MKLLVDMNLSPRWLARLAESGIEAVHWSSVGPHNATDEQIMAYAALNEYIVMTHDLDFGAILAATHGGKPSVVQIRAEDVSPIAIGATVLAALKQMEPELVAGALVTVDATRARLRVLPLRTKG